MCIWAYVWACDNECMHACFLSQSGTLPSSGIRQLYSPVPESAAPLKTWTEKLEFGIQGSGLGQSNKMSIFVSGTKQPVHKINRWFQNLKRMGQNTYCTRDCMCTSVCTYLYVCVYECVHVCVCTCMCVCRYMRVRLCVYICVCAPVYMRTCASSF